MKLSLEMVAFATGTLLYYFKTGRVSHTLALTMLVLGLGIYRYYQEQMDFEAVEMDIDGKLQYIDPLGQYPYLFLSPQFVHFAYTNRDILEHSNDTSIYEAMNGFLTIKYRLQEYDMQTIVEDVNMARDVLYPEVLNSFAAIELSLPRDYEALVVKFERSKRILHTLMRREMDAIKSVSKQSSMAVLATDDERARPSTTTTTMTGPYV